LESKHFPTWIKKFCWADGDIISLGGSKKSPLLEQEKTQGWTFVFNHGGTDMGDKGSKDKGKKEQQKKAQRSPKEKRQLKREKKKK